MEEAMVVAEVDKDLVEEEEKEKFGMITTPMKNGLLHPRRMAATDSCSKATSER